MDFVKFIEKHLKRSNFGCYILFFLTLSVIAGIFFILNSFPQTKDIISTPESNVAVLNNNLVEKPAVKRPIEVVQGVAIVKDLDKDLILRRIKEGKEFLFKMENPQNHGFYKKYEALTDSFENRVHTVYSASIIYTFLYLNDFKKDQQILNSLERWASFLLSMQNKKQGRAYGAFHYSYYFDERGKEQKFVVGTAALSIFTLLRLYEFTGDEKYLESAKLAGDWLMTMQKENGFVKPYVRFDGKNWVFGTKESLLYNGQVLSSLSKLYLATKEKKYLDTAEKIAKRFAQKIEESQGEFIEGEYRKKNPISNSWAVMSLLDFYRASKKEYYKNLIFPLSEKILKQQETDIKKILSYGQFKGAFSTSGNGWIAEVMTEMYRFCREEKRQDCSKYKEAVIRAIRWLIENTYFEGNVQELPNPERAIGGIFWNAQEKYVRTDSVCHALNAYVRIADYLEDGILLSLPEEIEGLSK